MSVFSERLAYILKERKTSQADLSKLTNIPKSAISQYISGKFNPKPERVRIICRALDINPAWLTGYDDAPKKGIILPTLSNEENEIISRYRTDKIFKMSVDAIMSGSFEIGTLGMFRAAKSKNGTIAPRVETPSKKRLKKLTDAPETPEDV